MYSSIEKSNNLVNKIIQYATDIIEGRKEIRRLSREAEEGRKQGGIRNVEATILLSRGGEKSSTIEGAKEQQQAIEDYAKGESIWHNRL